MAFPFSKNPPEPPPAPALPLRLWHLPQRRTHTRPKGDRLGVTETQTGTSSSDIMGLPTSEKKIKFYFKVSLLKI